MVSSVFVRFKKLAISLFDLVLIIIIFLWTRRGPNYNTGASPYAKYIAAGELKNTEIFFR